MVFPSCVDFLHLLESMHEYREEAHMRRMEERMQKYILFLLSFARKFSSMRL
jgi:hypothetical protein